MSYARWGEDSSVYVYLDVNGYLCCCGCCFALDGVDNRQFWTTADLIEHLHAHENAGHDVPDYAFTALAAQAAENDQWIGRAQAQVQAFIEMDLQGLVP